MDHLKKDLIQLLSRGNLLGAGLLVSAIRDNAFDANPYELCIERVVRTLESATKHIPQRPSTQAFRVNRLMFGKLGMAVGGGRPRLVIDDPDRFYLDRVIDNRSGSPMTMAILYWHMAKTLGLKCDCLAIPSYYLLRYLDRGREVYIDPYDGGRTLSADEFHGKFKKAFTKIPHISTNVFEQVTPFQIIARLIQQLKQIYIFKNNPLSALRAVELLMGLFPESPEFARDRGILYCEMEYFSRAADDLKFYLAKRAHAEDTNEIKRLSLMLKGYREVVN